MKLKLSETLRLYSDNEDWADEAAALEARADLLEAHNAARQAQLEEVWDRVATLESELESLRRGRRKITIDIDLDTENSLQTLARLHGWPAPADAVAYLVNCARDGLRRSGSWERGWLEQAFPLDMEKNEPL